MIGMLRNQPTPSMVVAAALAFSIAPSVAAGESDAASACISFWGETRFGGVGFTHVVHVANKCAASAVCAVSTDTEPTPQAVTVGGKQAVEVVTYLESPASKFTPRVTCSMQR